MGREPGVGQPRIKLADEGRDELTEAADDAAEHGREDA